MRASIPLEDTALPYWCIEPIFFFGRILNLFQEHKKLLGWKIYSLIITGPERKFNQHSSLHHIRFFMDTVCVWLGPRAPIFPLSFMLKFLYELFLCDTSRISCRGESSVMCYKEFSVIHYKYKGIKYNII